MGTIVDKFNLALIGSTRKNESNKLSRGLVDLVSLISQYTSKALKSGNDSYISVMNPIKVSKTTSNGWLQSQRKLLCQSLFTVAADRTVPANITRKNIYKQVMNFKGLDRSRQIGGYINELRKLSRYLLQTLNISLDQSSEAIHVSITNVNSEFPFINCKEHIYDAHDTNSCLVKLHSERQMPLNIAFLGDSHARYLMAQMLKDLESTFSMDESTMEKFHILYWKHIKYYWNLDLPLLNSTLFWLPFVRSESDDIYSIESFCQAFQNRTSTSYKPDLLIISSASWYATVDTADSFNHFEKNIKYLKKCLSEISSKIPVLWLVTGTATRRLSSAMDMLASLTWQMLRGTNIWVWDTPAVYAMREKSFICPEFLQNGSINKTFLVPLSWRCTEDVHGGWLYNVRAVNMMWNLVCNRVLGLNTTHCCS